MNNIIYLFLLKYILNIYSARKKRFLPLSRKLLLQERRIIVFLHSISAFFDPWQKRETRGDTRTRIKYHSFPGAVIKHSSKERKREKNEISKKKEMGAAGCFPADFPSTRPWSSSLI